MTSTDQQNAESIASRYLHSDGPCTVVQGLSEEVVAMLFAFFSRNERSFKETLVNMIDEGHLSPPPFNGFEVNERAKKFHERITIGYGHKSVADHAQLHWCLENVSAVAERDFLSARLLAATSKSTRYVNFRDAGFVTPEEWPSAGREGFAAHCEDLLKGYESLIPYATRAVRKLVPYEGWARDVWKKQSGWESATEKRALDMVRDLLPASIRTSFAVTCSATGLTELLNKREWDTDGGMEVADLASHVRASCSAAAPVLLSHGEPVPRAREHSVPMHFGSDRFMRGMRVRIASSPNWRIVQDFCGTPIDVLVRSWINDRARKMPPDRTAESAVYIFDIDMPFAIHRDLGRHRPMTQISSILSPNAGYGFDPLLDPAFIRVSNVSSELGILANVRQDILMRADERLTSWAGAVSASALRYACPLAAMVNVRWVVNVRELVHILGLRTTPQGHPSYRRLVQTVAHAMKTSDPIIAPLVDAVTNYDDVIVGRPG